MTPNHNEELISKIYEAVKDSKLSFLTAKQLKFTLADVLRALGKIESYFELGAIEDGRLLFKCDYESHNEYVYWNLAADLDGQTDEVKEFLWKIICSPK